VSSPVKDKAAKLLADDVIGDVKVARAWAADRCRIIESVPDSTAPTDGLALRRNVASTRDAFMTISGSFGDYGNGESGDDGIHCLDLACWGLGIDTVSSQFTARGGSMS